MRNLLVVLVFSILIFGTVNALSSNNSIVDFNASFDSQTKTILAFGRCDLNTTDATFSVSEEETYSKVTLRNILCSAEGNYFTFSDANAPDQNIPLNKTIKLTLDLNSCSSCARTIYLATIVTSSPSSVPVPDNNLVMVLLTLGAVIGIIFIKRKN